MNIFNQIKRTRNPRNKFDLSHERKMSANMGKIYPILLQEIIPTDSFKVSSEIFLRLAPMLAPIMHRVNVFTHYFFVPNRLVWDNWESFITGGEDGTEAPPFPKLILNEANKTTFIKGSLADYYGIPPIDQALTVTANEEINVLPFRAYQMIMSEYYRDQNLTPKRNYTTGDTVPGSEYATLNAIGVRSWEKDYFTSALPWPQRGANVLLPVNSSFSPQYKSPATATSSAGAPFPDEAGPFNRSAGAGTDIWTEGQSASVNPTIIENLVDPQQVDSTSVTINELRNATRLQEWLEKMARGGSRYAEQLLNMWGSKSSDARLQRPEYLGGGKQSIIISEVLNQAGTNTPASDPTDMQAVGEMSGHGISVGKNNGFTKTFEEHGFLIGLMSVLPRTAYQNGTDRMWSRSDKLDYYWADFAHLGEQEIKNKEVYTDHEDASYNEGTFGYTPRYAEYKYKQSSVHGDFRDNLKFWHMGRNFTTQPNLNTAFTNSDPTHDIFAVSDPTVDKLFIQIFNKISAVRPMPYYGTPYL